MTRPEYLSYLWIHVYEHVLLFLDLVVPLLHLCLDPLGESVASDRVDNIGNVLSWKLVRLLPRWKVGGYAWVSVGKGHHVFDSQSFKMRHIDVLCLITLDSFLQTRGQVS